RRRPALRRCTGGAGRFWLRAYSPGPCCQPRPRRSPPDTAAAPPRSPGRGRCAPVSARLSQNSARAHLAVSLGVLPTLTPAASRASFLAWAVPEDPDTIAPACPIVLPSGAVNPAT